MYGQNFGINLFVIPDLVRVKNCNKFSARSNYNKISCRSIRNTGSIFFLPKIKKYNFVTVSPGFPHTREWHCSGLCWF